MQQDQLVTLAMAQRRVATGVEVLEQVEVVCQVVELERGFVERHRTPGKGLALDDLALVGLDVHELGALAR